MTNLDTTTGIRDEIYQSCADDGFLLTQSEEEAQNTIHILTDTANDCGLEINKAL